MRILFTILGLIALPSLGLAQVMVPVLPTSDSMPSPLIGPNGLGTMNDADPLTGVLFGGDARFDIAPEARCVDELRFFSGIEVPAGNVILADGSSTPLITSLTGPFGTISGVNFDTDIASALTTTAVEVSVDIAAVDPGNIGLASIEFVNQDHFIGTFFADTLPDCGDDPDPILDPTCPSCDHVRGRLDRKGPGETFTDKMGNETFIADERELRARTNWNYFELGSSQTMARDRLNLAYYRGRDMAITKDSVWGVMGGIEAGQFDFAGGSAVTKVGLSVGAYAGRAVGNSGVLDTSLTATYFMNKMSDTMGNTADVGSLRVQVNGGLSGSFGSSEGWLMMPSLNIALSQERFDAYTIGGSGVAAKAVEGGTASLDFDLASPLKASGRFTFGIGASQELGAGFAPVGDVSAAVSIGWEANTMDKSVRKIELTASDVTGDLTDYRLSGVWERTF